MDFSDAFRISNLVAGGLMIGGGIGSFFVHLWPQVITIAVFEIIFGASTVLLEFQIPPHVARYASFMFSFLGRGAFYLFLGSIIMATYSIWNVILGAILGAVGISYIVLEFVPSIEPPANMRDADAGWGAEQV